MLDKFKVICMALVLSGLAMSASADIAVTLDPVLTVIDLNNPMPPYYVDIIADIPTADAIVGWGLDLNVALPAVASWTLSSIGPDWTGVPSPDLDNLAGLAFPNPISGISVLATVEFTGLTPGVTGIMPGVTPGDQTEGFVKLGGAFVPAGFTGATVEVIPEPATLTLLALAGLVVLRRR
jgi:hypothetical protein